MKLDFSKTFKGPDGKAYQLGGKETSASDASIMSLNHLGEHQVLSPEEKFKRYQLIQKIQKDEELSVEDRTLLKSAIGQFPFVPYLHGLLCDFVEGKEA